jgi:ubiquinone/menaquinone biosynthesis C-methylase UbiE
MSNYIHGSDPEEQLRLAKLNELINDRCLSLMNIQPGESILDIGSGLGQLTLAMASKAGPTGLCLGIERDLNQLAAAQQNLKDSHLTGVEFRRGNVEDLVLNQNEWGNFHLVHARFILEHVAKPDRVIHGMVHAARSGGRVVLADDDHSLMRLHPCPEGFESIWEAYVRSYETLGNDPFVGRRLVSLLNDAGLAAVRNNVVFFGDCAGNPGFSAYVNNLIGILAGARELILKHKLMPESNFDAAIQSIREWGNLKEAALWYVINWVEGTKP